MLSAILIISQGLNAITTIGPVAISVALQIKALLQSGDASFDVQIHALKDGAVENLDATDSLIKDWFSSHPE